MRVYKHPDGKNAGEGIHVCQARNKHLYNVPMMFYNESNHDYEFLTTSKFSSKPAKASLVGIHSCIK